MSCKELKIVIYCGVAQIHLCLMLLSLFINGEIQTLSFKLGDIVKEYD